MGIRRLLAARCREFEQEPDRGHLRNQRFIDSCGEVPIALTPASANAQHYEVAPEFFALWLGPRRKYSCGYWTGATASLKDAELESLRRTCQHAEIDDGMRILELGCGWGALTLWMAEQYPSSQILAVSNSSSQRRVIEAAVAERGWSDRVEVETGDMNTWQPAGRFDRCVSIEMFEHMRNYGRLLARIASWMDAGGKLLVHAFAHRQVAYAFESSGAANWMGKYFFEGGTMPHLELLAHFDQDMVVTRQWQWLGTHYARTLEAWLERLDRSRGEAVSVLQCAYGDAATLWYRRWRMFLMACAELFRYRGGTEWLVGHTLLELSRERRRLR
jgi:cyclopropane-fatty-acyl-phospholipid synthase